MGRVRLTILPLPILLLYTGSKSPVERRPPPELAVDLVQAARSRETNLLPLWMEDRMALQLAVVSCSSSLSGTGLLALSPPLLLARYTAISVTFVTVSPPFHFHWTYRVRPAPCVSFKLMISCWLVYAVPLPFLWVFQPEKI